MNSSILLPIGHSSIVILEPKLITSTYGDQLTKASTPSPGNLIPSSSLQGHLHSHGHTHTETDTYTVKS